MFDKRGVYVLWRRFTHYMSILFSLKSKAISVKSISELENDSDFATLDDTMIEFPIATADVLGVVRVDGETILINADGVISIDVPSMHINDS